MEKCIGNTKKERGLQVSREIILERGPWDSSGKVEHAISKKLFEGCNYIWSYISIVG
jgi:hypothetical protein